tara:strand:+ start:113 stop:304 length:192 start_codon:yes stop_codon:yes gene_type:complete
VAYFPNIDERLVAALSEQFPDQCPDLSLSEKEVWFKSGQASVIKWLKRRLEEQENDVYQLEAV